MLREYIWRSAKFKIKVRKQLALLCKHLFFLVLLFNNNIIYIFYWCAIDVGPFKRLMRKWRRYNPKIERCAIKRLKLIVVIPKRQPVNRSHWLDSRYAQRLVVRRVVRSVSARVHHVHRDVYNILCHLNIRIQSPCRRDIWSKHILFALCTGIKDKAII
jgi:hypothetical protein